MQRARFERSVARLLSGSSASAGIGSTRRGWHAHLRGGRHRGTGVSPETYQSTEIVRIVFRALRDADERARFERAVAHLLSGCSASAGIGSTRRSFLARPPTGRAAWGSVQRCALYRASC